MNTVERHSKKKTGAALAVWLLIALGMLLAPAPREWGAFGKLINSYYDHTRLILQPAAHSFLMAIGVVLLMHYFSHHPPFRAFLISAVAALSCAIVFELLQNLLPSGFARQCDIEDLIPSTAGALVGGIIGLRQRLRNKDGNK